MTALGHLAICDGCCVRGAIERARLCDWTRRTPPAEKCSDDYHGTVGPPDQCPHSAEADVRPKEEVGG